MNQDSMLEHIDRNRAIQGITLERIKRSLSNRMMNHLARFDFARSYMSSGYVAKQGITSELFPGVSADNLELGVRREGVSFGLQLPKTMLNELHNFSTRTPVYADRNPSFGFYMSDFERAQMAVNKKFSVATYYDTYWSCSSIRELTKDPLINEVALRYVGPYAKCLGTSMWWSYPNPSSEVDKSQYAQLFHYDLDDYKFIKFFFYLTDVDLSSGPHVYVKGTHRNKYWRHIYPKRRLSDDEVVNSYGRNLVFQIQGASGTGFVSDTFGIHKGETPQRNSRLMMELYFGISKGFTVDGNLSEREMIKL